MSRKVVIPFENQTAPDASSQTTALERVLNWITSSSPINRDRGTNFERLCIAFLKNCPRWTAVFSDVLPFGEWAKKHEKTVTNARDTGIDLVGIRHDGTFTAIQCKFFTSKATVSKPEIDSFIAASALTNTVGHNGFHDRLLISTAPLNANALKTIHENRVLIVTRDELKESGFNWACYLPKEGRFEKDAREHQDLRAYQEEAVTAVTNAFLKKNAEKLERAQIHMACGTGKTLTSLRIAEKVAGEGKLVLFLAPSLGLVQQTLDAWTNFSDVLIRPYVVCSDGDMGKRIEDIEGTRFEIQTLAYPATTDPASLLKAFHKGNRGGNRLNGQKTHMPMTVIFATYQSLNVIHHAQQMQNGLKEFDLIICDEAHRTTGQIEDSDDPGMFQRVTEADYLWGAHRLFMTATPRVYSPTAVTRARQDGMKLASMDDAALYGPVVFEYSFRQAVDDEWLADYRLVVLRVQEKDVREMLAQSPDKAISSSHEDGDENPVIQLDDMKLDDAARIVGCWRAMIGHDLAEDEGKPEGAEKTIPQQMKRAVAFCSSIEAHNNRVSSKVIANAFTHVTNLYNEQNSLRNLHAKARHVDGSMSSNERKDALDWLRENTEEGTSRILTNVRCLSEGIDVPSLDAALFMSPRNSTVDIIQSVGRVMRKAPGKKLGYIIVPIVIPDEITDDNIENWLDNSNSGFATLYKLAAALRSHDPQLEADANQVAIGARHNITNLLTITTLPRKHKKLAEHVADGGTNLLREEGEKTGSIQGELALHSIDTFGGAVRARLVKRLGSGVYWDEWAHKAGTIATRLVTEITHIRKTTTSSDPVAIETCVKAQKAFSTLLATMRKMLNASITEDQLTGMLAQHIVTLPLFEALFGDSEATRTEKNPVARELEPCITAFRNTGLTRFEGVELRNFWQEVQRSVRGMNAVGRQKVIKTLYEKFIRNAFPKEAKSFGVVYTPPEIVDFILHSIQHVMKENFGHGMEAENVHVLDPFTGTGTFIARLLASDILTPDQVREKYNSAIWANEIMLLTYYIATINIETEYAAITGEWTPFRGAVLADTFTLDDSDLDRLAGLHGNADRIRSEVADRNIRVIFGNPPYSAGATKAADGTENISYPSLDKRIETTYAAASTSANKNSLYDSYIRAIRWASDRLGNQGVIGFVSNAGFLESAAAAGIRKCLAEEFSDIQVFHLRGGIRGKSGDMARQEGGSVFNIMTAVAITILVKNPPKASRDTIHFHDIGNCLSRNEKLAKIASFKSVKGISQANAWHNITPDEHSDWLGQRDESFGAFISIGDKKNPRTPVLFDLYSNGLQTNRDAWVWNFSRTEAEQSVKRMVEVYERERARLHPAFPDLTRQPLPAN